MSTAHALPEPLSRAYDRWADTYDHEYASRPETASEDALVVSWLRDRLPAGSSLIDAGCGTGWLLDRLDWPRALYLGFDISNGMLDRAAQKHPGRPFIQRSILDPWPSYPHDWRAGTPRVATAMWAVLNHVTDPDLDLAFRRFADSGGDQFFSTLRLPQAPGSTAAGHDADLGDHVHTFTFTRLSQAVRRAGLTIADHFGFVYGGALASVDEAHYLALEVTR